MDNRDVTNKEALKYIDRLCTKYDLQVETIIDENSKNTFVVDYHNQFSINKLVVE